MTIVISLEPGLIDSTAIITERRWFRKPTQTEYICVGVCPFSGGKWVNTETNEFADEYLNEKLNKAAQSEADRRLMDLRKEMGWF